MTGHGGPPDKRPEVYALSNTLARVKNIRTPLLIMHGEADVRAPFHQYELAVAELEKYGKQFESKTYPNEPHGFRNPANRVDMYQRLEAFLDRHLKQSSPSQPWQPVVEVPRRTEPGEAPGWQGARSKNRGSIRATSNAARRDASPGECSGIFTLPAAGPNGGRCAATRQGNDDASNRSINMLGVPIKKPDAAQKMIEILRTFGGLI